MFIISSGEDPLCSENEVYSECGNDGCQDTCENPILSQLCDSMGCQSGCICKEGYLRNTKGKCVLYEDCDTCKPNEFLKRCVYEDCEKTCDEPDKDVTCIKDHCTPKCICRPEYLRDVDGTCVKPELCKTSCQEPNEIYDRCGEMCPTTCANKDLGPRICPNVCAKGGCVCKKGYVRSTNQTCIKPEECPKCPTSNEFFACGPSCDVTCTSLGLECMNENKKCTEMCYCKPGFVRDFSGECIPVEQCQKICPTDKKAIVLPCGDPCPTTCTNKDDGPRPCPRICLFDGCKCDFGHVQNDAGKCIPSDECPKPCATDPNAEWLPCGDPCPATCDNWKNLKRKCQEKCVPGCKCKDGYVLDSSGKCILTKDCMVKCKENEVHDKCPKKCIPEMSCQTQIVGIKSNCMIDKNCKPRCVCKEGYVKDVLKNGKCVPTDDCSKYKIFKLTEYPNALSHGNNSVA